MWSSPKCSPLRLSSLTFLTLVSRLWCSLECSPFLLSARSGFKALHLTAILHFLSCLEKFSVIIEIELYSYVLHTNQSDQSISLRTDTIGA
ncbi:unnamed protein product [Lactuca virosa]|uniref:Secreted protein n=1 Tax=Lactuca virosa TaxID=75947 RepID=A0AAU9N2Q4_9ASTR|nr:unnamed protein product [Lactuca virosa]